MRIRASAAIGVLPLALGCNALLGVGDLPAPSDAGGADGPPGLDGGASDGHFCEQEATFCADFDESEDPASGWTSSSNNNGQTTLELDDVFVRSAPRALHVVIPSDTPICADATLTKELGLFSKSRVEVSLRPSATNTGGYYHQGAFFYFGVTVDATTYCHVLIGAASDKNAFVAEDDFFPDGGEFYAETDLGRLFRAEEWRKVVITIDRTASPTKFDVSVDDDPVASGHMLDACSGPLTRSLLLLGFDCTNFPHDLRYDDVRCDLTP